MWKKEAPIRDWGIKWKGELETSCLLLLIGDFDSRAFYYLYMYIYICVWSMFIHMHLLRFALWLYLLVWDITKCNECPPWTVLSTLRRPLCICGFWRMVTYLALCDRFVVATGPLPAMGRGTRHLAANVIFLLLLLTPFGTCSFSEHGHVNKYSWEDSERLSWATVYSNCDFLLSPWQQRRSRVSLFWVATNSFVARFWVCCDTVGFYANGQRVDSALNHKPQKSL